MNQRHRDRRTSFRPSDPIDPSLYEVALIAGDREPRAFVQQHHYSGSYPAARLRVGLYRRAKLVGVAVFSHPPSEEVLKLLPCERMAGVELGRFVLLDDVPGNGESWFLGRCFGLLRAAGIECLISHSDPVARYTAHGELVLPGHVGTIYQSTNGIYAGRTRSQLLNVLPDGRVFGERSVSKLRSGEQGWERAAEILVAAGAAPPAVPLEPGGKNPDLRWRARRDWMWQAIGQICRRQHHSGCHRYVWALHRSMRRRVAELARGPYPKAQQQLTFQQSKETVCQ